MASRKTTRQAETTELSDYKVGFKSIGNTLSRMEYKVNQIDVRLNKHYRLLKEILESYWMGR